MSPCQDCRCGPGQGRNCKLRQPRDLTRFERCVGYAVVAFGPKPSANLPPAPAFRAEERKGNQRGDEQADNMERRHPPAAPFTPETADSVGAAAQALARAGVLVEPAQPPTSRAARLLASARLLSGTTIRFASRLTGVNR